MDWNNDGRIDGKDYTLFHEVIDKESSSAKTTYNAGSYDDSGPSTKGIVGFIICEVLALVNLFCADINSAVSLGLLGFVILTFWK